VITPEAAHDPQQLVEDERVTAWVSADTVELVDQLTGRDLTLNRRRAGQALATIACGAPLLEALERWLVRNDLRPGAGAVSGVGHQEIEQIEYAARLFREWDDQFGGGLRRKAVVGQLNEVAELLHERHPPAIRRRLFGVMAQLAETAAIMSWDSGYQGLAQHYYLLAFRSARTAGDHAFGAVVLAGMARQLLYLDKAQDALELVRMAQDSAVDHTTPAVRAMLHTREAWAFAKLGRLTAFRRATDQAEEALTGSQPAAEPHWIGHFDAAELDGTTGGRLLELAHQDTRYAAEAAGRIGRALISRGAGHLRSGALDQIGLAEARLIEGECEEAARLGHAAVTLAKQTSSDRVRIKLAELYRYSTSKASAPAVAELRERIRSAVVPQSA
jgi:hypothetical protein